MFQKQANGSHENDGREEIGGKDGFGIESGGDREGMYVETGRYYRPACLVSH